MAQLIGGRQQVRLGSVPSQIVLRRGRQYIRITPAVEGLDGVFFAGARSPCAEPEGTVHVVNVFESLFIFDFEDQHHPLLHNATRRRRRTYWAAGWKVDGHKLNPLKEWLNNRTEEFFDYPPEIVE
jgi:hypothetical protein